jgi:hypothetical protein
VTPPQALLAAGVLAVWPALAGAQQITIGPEFGVSEYREAAASLRFRGNGPGAAARIRFHRLTAEGSYVSLGMDPTDDSQATESFRATLIDAWLRWEALSFLGVEVGLLHRSTDSEFAAQSVGALRVGARTQAPLGPGADVWLRGYFAVAFRWRHPSPPRSASGWMSAGRTACGRPHSIPSSGSIEKPTLRAVPR